MTALLASLGFVVLAEMGDKTQLLAMAFACRYRAATVMWGVFAATAFNHLLAVLAGHYLTQFVPIRYIQIAAAASFILFGLWTIRGDRLEGEDKRFNFSPFWTVAVAFFLAEMGDKTQLATISLAAKYQSVWPVLAGTTAGMLIADAIGIGVGVVLGKNIPERVVKWAAAVIFILFGLYGLYEYLPAGMLTVPVSLLGLTAIVVAICILGRGDFKRVHSTSATTQPGDSPGGGGRELQAMRGQNFDEGLMYCPASERKNHPEEVQRRGGHKTASSGDLRPDA